MILPLLATLAALSSGAARAAESASTHYSNISLGGPSATASPSPPAPGSEAKPVRRRAAPARPAPAPILSKPAAAPLSETIVPKAPLWPWTVLGAILVFGAAILARSRQARKERDAGETLAMAAHELKSPLAAIESYLDLMSRDAPSDARGVRLWLEDVRRMKSTAAHLRRTIGDILDMTRIEDGRLKLSPCRLPLGPLLTEVAAEYGALARDRGVRVSVDAPFGMPVASADPDRLRQVLHNLLSNALKFTPSGGSVRMSARSEGAHLSVDVLDNGVGIPPGKREKLFGKFARLAPTLDDTEGTGLGLYISRRLVEAQGGRLSYAPGPDGRGSLFRVTLPRGTEAP